VRQLGGCHSTSRLGIKRRGTTGSRPLETAENPKNFITLRRISRERRSFSGMVLFCCCERGSSCMGFFSSVYHAIKKFFFFQIARKFSKQVKRAGMPLVLFKSIQLAISESMPVFSRLNTIVAFEISFTSPNPVNFVLYLKWNVSPSTYSPSFPFIPIFFRYKLHPLHPFHHHRNIPSFPIETLDGFLFS
jgi:hypothetical protein